MGADALKTLTERSNLAVRRLSPAVGAEVAGLNLRDALSAAGRAELRALLLQHKVLFFRDQPLTRDEHLAFAAQFGELYAHPSGGVDGHRIIQPISAQAVRASEYRENHWHTDTSWRINPSFGAVLRAVNVPEFGGDTIWASGSAIYQGLSEALKARIDNLYVIHDFQDALTKAGETYPLVAHPIVRTHPETGEDIFWVNFSLKPRIVDLDRAESDALLAELYHEVKKPEHHVRFSWRPNSVALWDNRAALHYAVRDYGDFPRVMERVLIASDDIPHRVRKPA